MNLLQINSNRFWILWSIKQDVNDNAFTTYEGLVIVARDDRNETTILVRQYASSFLDFMTKFSH
jgi:hypothetical protein